MDALKLVSTIGNHSTFGNAAPEIHIEDNGDDHGTGPNRATLHNTDDAKPKKVSVLHPPDGGKRAWKMVGICTFLNVCLEIISNLVKHSDGLPDDLGKDLVEVVYILYEGFSIFGGVFAALLSLKYKYRIIGIAGSFAASFGLLIASVVPVDNIEYRNLIAFLVSCLSGIGCGFMRYIITVVVLENFTTKRVKALIITNIGSTVVSFAFTGLMEIKKVHPQVVIPWRHAFRYQGIGMAAAVISSGLIRTLRFEPDPSVKKSHRHPHHRLQYSDFTPKDWKALFMDLTFYLYAIFLLLYDFAEHLPAVGDITGNQPWAFNSDQIIATKFVPHMGFVCASLPMCMWKNQTLANILAVLGPITFIAGLATCVILPYTDFGLIVFYGVLFAFSGHCIMWMLLDVVPDEFGRNNTRITLGVVSFIGGASTVGSAYAKELAESYITEPKEKFKAVFILAGALVMVAGVFAILTRCLIVLHKDPDRRIIDENL